MQNCLEFNNDYMDYYFQNSKHNIQKKLEQNGWFLFFILTEGHLFLSLN